MGETFGAPFSADMVALTRAVIEAAPVRASEVPPEMRQRIIKITPTADRRDRMLARDVDGLSVAWGADDCFAPAIGADHALLAAAMSIEPLDRPTIEDICEALGSMRAGLEGGAQ